MKDVSGPRGDRVLQLLDEIHEKTDAERREEAYFVGMIPLMTATVSKCEVMNGVLAVNKEAGWTSHDVVAKLRQLLGGAKVGHAGTLDPAATGVLPLLIGKGTRIAEYLVEWDKEYRAVSCASVRPQIRRMPREPFLTVTRRRHLTPAAIHEAVGRFRGAIEQVPPMYSAVKVDGVPLYQSARAGKTIARDARTVVIHELEVLAMSPAARMSHSGWCVRRAPIFGTLCADIGRRWESVAICRTLERSRVGPLTSESSSDCRRRSSASCSRRSGGPICCRSMMCCEHLPVVVVDEQTADRVRHGAPVPWSDVVRQRTVGCELNADMAVRIHDGSGRLLAMGRLSEPCSDPIAVEKVLVDSVGTERKRKEGRGEPMALLKEAKAELIKQYRQHETRFGVTGGSDRGVDEPDHLFDGTFQAP